MTESGGTSFDEVLAQVRPKTTTVRVCLRGDLLARHEELEHQLAEAQRLDETENRIAQAPQVAREIEALEAELTETETSFTFAAIGFKAWTDLVADHPPRDEDREDGYDFNQATFPQVAIAASAVSPKMTVEQVERLFEVLNRGQLQPLIGAALLVNVQGTSVPFSEAASATLRGSEAKFDSPTPTASLALSS
jgi:hypothetical protein